MKQIYYYWLSIAMNFLIEIVYNQQMVAILIIS